MNLSSSLRPSSKLTFLSRFHFQTRHDGALIDVLKPSRQWGFCSWWRYWLIWVSFLHYPLFLVRRGKKEQPSSFDWGRGSWVNPERTTINHEPKGTPTPTAPSSNVFKSKFIRKCDKWGLAMSQIERAVLGRASRPQLESTNHFHSKLTALLMTWRRVWQVAVVGFILHWTYWCSQDICTLRIRIKRYMRTSSLNKFKGQKEGRKGQVRKQVQSALAGTSNLHEQDTNPGIYAVFFSV